MSGWRGRVALLLASGVVACALAEVGLRLAGYEALSAVYSTPELFWRHDPRIGWSLEPDARGRFVGPRPHPVEFDTAIEVNSLGLRSPEIGPRAPGELRVLFLGDSFVAGFEVERAETFTALIEGPLTRRFGVPVRAINAGVRGYGTDQSYLWFLERGRTLGADLVVAVFSENDFDDNVTLHRARRPFGKPAFALRPNGSLELVGVPVPDYEPCSTWLLDANYVPVRADGALARAACFLEMRLADHSALFTVVASSLSRVPGLIGFLNRIAQPGAQPAPAEASLLPGAPALCAAVAAGGIALSAADRARIEGALTTALLRALAREVRASGADFLLLMIPRHWERIDLPALRADGIDVEYVTLDPALDPRRIYFRNDAHLNAFGHRLYADALVPVVERALRSRQESAPAR